jgi:predicted ATPase
VLKKLVLKNFKNFKEAEIQLGPLSVLVGTNASGKSNIRDALRFLHGIGLGYSLADIFGEKYGPGGVLQWNGIRGGIREITYMGSPTFTLEATFEFYEGLAQSEYTTYLIEVEPNYKGGPRVVREALYFKEDNLMVFDSHPDIDPPQQTDPKHLTINIQNIDSSNKNMVGTFIADHPILDQILDRFLDIEIDEKSLETLGIVSDILDSFRSIRFLDLSAEAMRTPSFPGQTVLGDRGENLSSVLMAICESEQHKKALVEWLQELTPMDAVDFEFPADQQGRVLVSLVEENGKKTSAYSASDGTLRFLAMIAALLGPESSHVYFFEELENGIHPTRLYLLLQLIERKISKSDTTDLIETYAAPSSKLQVIATSHSPQLLRFLSPGSLEKASLIYRLPGHADAKIKRILDISEAKQLIEQQDIGHLYESGWLEDAVAFLDEVEVAQ